MFKKLLIVGIDAMDPKISKRLISAGRLPNFAKLHFSELATTTPPETPVAWSAIATGMNPGRYGIYDFLTRDLQSYLPKLNLAEEKAGLVKTKYSCNMKGAPFWRTLSAHDVPVSVVRWPVTFPPEKINGRMLSGLGVVDIRGSMNRYSFFTTDSSRLDGEGKEKVKLLPAGQTSYETEIAGPLVQKRGALKEVTCPLKIDLDGNVARLRVGEYDFKLGTGEWSELLRIKFKVLPFYDLFGVCNFYLSSMAPHFELYVSSVQIDPANQAVEITSPTEYGKELSEKIGLFYTLGMAEDTKAVTEGKLSRAAFLTQVQQIECEREKMFEFEFSRFKEGVLAFVFDAGDRLNHIFWRNSLSSEHSDLAPEIEQYYLDKDRFLGKLIERCDSETALMVLSDHGFSDFRRQVNINSWLVQENYLKVRSNNHTELFAQVEWSQSSAYALGFTSVFLNLEGREAQGVVPQSDRDALAEEIVAKLKRFKDGDRDVFTNVYLGRELFKGPYAEQAPDIVLGFAPGYRMAWRAAIGGLDDEMISDNTSEWQGDHLIDPTHVPGVLFTNFAINSGSPTVFDIAPTILRLMGTSEPEKLDGASLI